MVKKLFGTVGAGPALRLLVSMAISLGPTTFAMGTPASLAAKKKSKKTARKSLRGTDLVSWIAISVPSTFDIMGTSKQESKESIAQGSSSIVSRGSSKDRTISIPSNDGLKRTQRSSSSSASRHKVGLHAFTAGRKMSCLRTAVARRLTHCASGLAFPTDQESDHSNHSPSNQAVVLDGGVTTPCSEDPVDPAQSIVRWTSFLLSSIEEAAEDRSSQNCKTDCSRSSGNLSRVSRDAKDNSSSKVS